MTKNKGFTLIELIMVITILGILSAVSIPRYYDFATHAHEANEKAVIGTIRTALNLYAVDKFMNTGFRSFPDADDIESDGDLLRILKNVPDHWEVTSTGGGDNKVRFTYTDPATDYIWEYECDGSTNTPYTLTKIQ